MRALLLALIALGPGPAFAAATRAAPGAPNVAAPPAAPLTAAGQAGAAPGLAVELPAAAPLGDPGAVELAAKAPGATPGALPELRALLLDDPRTAIFSPAGFAAIAETIDSIDPSPRMDRLHSELGFRALVEEEPAARQALAQDVAAHPDALKGVKNAMYFSLVRVMAAEEVPLEGRVRTASELAERYAAFFDGLAGSSDRRVREDSARAAQRLRDPRSVVAPLAYERRLAARFRELEAAYRRLRPAAEGPARSPQPWVVPEPKPPSASGEERETAVRPMAGLEEELRGLAFGVERYQARLRLARQARFSDALREKVEREAKDWLDWLGRSLDYWKASASRFSDVTIGRTFLDQRQHRITGIPDHPGLSLVPERGGFRIEARFKTDIADSQVRDIVKRSIEEYWTGDFRYAGRRHHLRTRVTLAPLKPGEEFPKDWLRLVDAKDGMTHAGHTGIALGRNPANFDYGVPAHEFGHILGLDDQYTESFDPETWSSIDTGMPGSLMGSRSGSVLERDLKLVWQLLRRRRLVPANPVRRWLTELKRRWFPRKTVEPEAPVTPVPPAEVAARRARADAAQAQWAALPLRERARRMLRFWRTVRARRRLILDTVRAETGKPEPEIDIMELATAGMNLKYYARTAARFLQEPADLPWFMRLMGLKGSAGLPPLGVVGVITPWNFPFLIPFDDMIQPLLAGNAVLLKPSEVTPRTALLIERLFNESGLFPKDLLQVLPGDGLTGAAVIDHSDFVQFTGSGRTGERVRDRAEANGIDKELRVLELGGKHAMIVLKDAPLERAAKAAVMGAFANCGQACIGVEKVYVERAVYPRFVELVRRQMRALRSGKDFGRMIFPGQLEVVRRHLEDAAARGARIEGRGVTDAGRLQVEPTLILGLEGQPGALALSEETFGPLLPVVAVDDADEAVEAVNAGRHGLSGSLWTRDRTRISDLRRRLQVGVLEVNGVLTTYGTAALPFGGLRGSGEGRRHGPMGILKFTDHRNAKALLVNRAWLGLGEFWWMPYSRLKAFLARLLERLS